MRKIFYSLVVVLVSLSLYGCNEVDTNKDFLTEAFNTLTIQGDLNNVVDDVILTTKIGEVTITWESSNNAVITNTGKVTRQAVDTNVTLSAELEYKDKTKDKDFNLIVLKLNQEGLTDQEKVNLAYNSLTLNYDLDNITTHLTLPTMISEVSVSWESSNPEVVSNTGYVVRTSVDEEVMLTATLTLNAASDIKQFDLYVLAKENSENEEDRLALNEALEMFDLEGDLSNVTEDLVLPSNYKSVQITWSSDNEEALTSNGEITQTIDDVKVRLTATLTIGELSDNIIFTVTVKARELTDAEKLTKAVNSLTIKGDLENVKYNLEYTYSLYDTTVTYQSSNEAVVSNDGKVNRTYEDEVITLTATLTINGLEDTKEFTITVLGYEFCTVKEARDLAINNLRHLNEVVVIAKTETGFYITDNIDVIYVYSDVEVELLDKLIISGTSARHRDLIQLKDVKVTKLGKGEITLEPTELSVKELSDIYSGKEAAYGYIQLTGRYNDGVFSGIENSEVILASNTLYKDSLDAYNNKKIVVNIFVQWMGSKGWEVVLANDTIKEAPLTDLEKLDEIKNSLTLDKEVREDLNLITSKDGATITWQSSNTDVLSDNGEVIVRGDKDVNVTLTATITLNGEVVTKVFNLTVIQYEKTDLEIIEEVKENLTIEGDLDNVTDKLTLVKYANNYEVKIEWESSNIGVVDTNGYIVRQDVDTTVTLTATIKLNDASLTKEFTVTVKAIETMTIKEVLESSLDTSVVVRDAIVMSIAKDGYFITDNTDIIFVYTKGTPQVELNDVVLIEGTRAAYNGLQQIKDSKITVTGTEEVTLEPTLITMEDFYNLDNVNGYYRIYGTLTNKTTLTNGDNKITIHANSNPTSFSLLNDYVGEDITINLFAHFTNSSVIDMYFNGTVEDITLRELTDEEKVAKTVSELSVVSKTYEDIFLPTTNSTYGTTISWVSSDTTILSNSGVVTRPENDTEVTLTATITSGAINGNKEFKVIIIGTASGDVETLEIDFRIGANMGTEYKTNTFKFFDNTVFKLSNLTSTWGGVDKGVDGGIKFGSGSKNGSFTITSDEVTITKVVVVSKLYGSDGSNLVVNGQSQKVTADFTSYEFEINSNKLTIGSNAKRIWVESITIFYQ